MAFIHPQSCECVKSELDLFNTPPTQTSIESGVWTHYHPISSLETDGPIEFNVPGSGDDYLDLAQTQLLISAKIVKPDGTALDANQAVGPVNLFIHSLFSQIDVALNDKLISQSSNTYPYRAYLETLMNYGTSALTSQLTTSLWYKDTSGQMDSTALEGDDVNKGFVKRAKFSAASATIDLVGKIHSDIFFQQRYLMNGVNLRVRLVRSSHEFALLTGLDTAFKVVITNAALRIRKVKLSPNIQLAHAKALQLNSAKYPLHRVEVKVFSVPAGNLSTCQENLFLGQLPKRIIIGCVDNDALNGSYKKNPFNFKNFSLNYIALHVDGHQDVIKPLQPNFTTGNYIQCFADLFMGIGKLYKDEGVEINREDFKEGYCLYAFDLSPDMSDGGHFNLIKSGNMRLEMKFGVALPNTVNVVVYAEFENMLEINKDKNVIVDFAL